MVYTANRKSETMSYEETRKKRMEENRKRMAELNLHNLSKALKPSLNNTIKRNNVKTVFNGPPRRSTRTAVKSPPNYKFLKRASMKTIGKGEREYTIVRSNLFYRVSTSEQDRVYTTNKAKELASSLGTEFPTFVKPITSTHVVGGCFRLPETFCKTHLPEHNDIFTIVDEDKEECQLNYRVKWKEFGSGWRKFSARHQLIDGDALVFQLTKPNTFKVYIIRVNKVISCF